MNDAEDERKNIWKEALELRAAIRHTEKGRSDANRLVVYDYP